ncbi:MAG: hypothetical protein IKE51_02525, partial [Solobacterium sp.]|nr:hypothetical protein [Solobacterium sp.]
MVKKKKLKKDSKIKDQSNKQKNPHPSPKNDGGMNPTGVFLSIFIIAILCTTAYLGYLWNNGKIQIGAIDYSSFASSTPTPTPTPT